MKQIIFAAFTAIASLALPAIVSAQSVTLGVSRSDIPYANFVSGDSVTLAGNCSATTTSFSFYVKGDGSGYNDGNWHLVANVPASSNAGAYTWTAPNDPGQGSFSWHAEVQAWNGGTLVGTSSTTDFSEYPQPQGVGLVANDVVSGGSISFQAHSTEQAGNLGTLSYYVQAPGASSWTNVGASSASGVDATGNYSFTPTATGAWKVMLQTWDASGNVNDPNLDVSGPITTFNVLSSGGPKGQSLFVSNANIGNPVTFTARATESDTSASLQTFSFYVQGPGSGYNDGSWHLVSAIAASSTDFTGTTTWTPNAPGVWKALLQTWDTNSAVDGSKTCQFVVNNPASGAYSFQILVDVNTMTSTEAGSIAGGNNVLAADGLYAIVENSPGVSNSTWESVFASIGASTWAVTEDDPTSSNEYSYVSAQLGRTLDGGLCYQENNVYPNDTTLTPYQIDQAAPSHGDNVIAHSRSYIGASGLGDWNDHRGYFAKMALTDAFCGGLAFETTPIGSGDWNARHYSDGIDQALSQGRRAYVLIVANESSSNYASDVIDTISSLSSAELSNPNVYIVLANYGSNVPFLDPSNLTSTTNTNTIAGALASLKSWRAPGGH